MPDRRFRDFWWLFIAGRSAREWDPPRSEKARKREDRRDTVNYRRNYDVVNGRSKRDGSNGGVPLGTDTARGECVEAQRPHRFHSAYAHDSASWEVQQTVQEEIVVYDENGEVIPSPSTQAADSLLTGLNVVIESQHSPPKVEIKGDASTDSIANSAYSEEEKLGPPRQPTPAFLMQMDNVRT